MSDRRTSKFIARKQELLDCIFKMIEERGFEDITVREICAELNVSTGTFYHYFPEKSDIALALFSTMDEYYRDEVEPRFGPDEAENLVEHVLSYGRYAVRTGLRACKYISITPLVKSNGSYFTQQRAIHTILVQLLERGVEKGQFHLEETPEEIAQILLVLMRGYTGDWAKHDGEYDLLAALERFARLFLKSLK